jgi:hypothetical protein
MAKSIGLSPLLFFWLISAPFSRSFITISYWFLLIEIERAVSPFGVIMLGFAPLLSTKSNDYGQALKAALMSNVCLESFFSGLSMRVG